MTIMLRSLLTGISLIAIASSAQAMSYSITAITVPGSAGTTITGVNNLDQVSGFYMHPNGEYSSFIWTAGTFTYFDLPASYNQIPSNVTFLEPNLLTTIVDGINDHGDLVGQYNNQIVGISFVYSNGVVTTISPNYLAPADINDFGQITGSTGVQGFIATAGTITTIPQTNQTYYIYSLDPVGINNSGTVSGDIVRAGDVVGFIYDASGLQTIIYPDPKTVSTKLYGLNDLGQAVGTAVIGPFSSRTSNQTYVQFIYDGGTFESLNLPFGPQDINDSGVIVGTGGATDPNHPGNIGYIAIPIATTMPEPGSIGSAAVGLLAALGLRRRRRQESLTA